MSLNKLKLLLGLPEDATDDDVYTAVDRLVADRDLARLRVDDLRCAAQAAGVPDDVSTLMRALEVPPSHPQAIPIALRQVKRLRALAAKAEPAERDIAALRADVSRLRAQKEHLKAACTNGAAALGERNALVLVARYACRALRFGLEAGDAGALAVAARAARKSIRQALARLSSE